MNHTFVSETVKLDFYKQEYISILENYYLPEDQIRYTAYPKDAIAKCENDDDRYPIVILYNNVPVGFFALHGWDGVKAYSENRNAILIRGYSVNNSFQGKGIAKQSLKLLPNFVKEHFPDKNEIILAVNHRNELAQHVYKKGGFIDKGIRAMGRKGELLIMHNDIG